MNEENTQPAAEEKPKANPPEGRANIQAVGYKFTCPHCNAENQAAGVPASQVLLCEGCGKAINLGDVHHNHV